MSSAPVEADLAAVAVEAATVAVAAVVEAVETEAVVAGADAGPTLVIRVQLLKSKKDHADSAWSHAFQRLAKAVD